MTWISMFINSAILTILLYADFKNSNGTFNIVRDVIGCIMIFNRNFSWIKKCFG